METLQFTLQKGKNDLVFLKPLFGNYSQLQAVCKCINDKPKSMRTIELETGIPRPNICWYLRYLKSRKQVIRIKFAVCPYTRRKVGFYIFNANTYSNDWCLFD